MRPIVFLTDHPKRLAPMLAAVSGSDEVSSHCLPRHQRLALSWPIHSTLHPEVALICSTPAHAMTVVQACVERWPKTLLWVHDCKLLVNEQIELLQRGADVVSTQTLSHPEVRARLKSLQRRHSLLLPKHLHVGRFEYDEDGKVILLDGRKLPLSAREWLVLGQMLKRHPALCSREELQALLARHRYGCSDQILDMNLHKLREKIHPLGVQIQTLRGLGYRLNMQAASTPKNTSAPDALPNPPELMRLFFGNVGGPLQAL
jgi:DNA-binding winged helix-turn-helix (wHTH) protein